MTHDERTLPDPVGADEFRVWTHRLEPDAPPGYFLAALRDGEPQALIVTTRDVVLALYFALVSALDLMPETPDPSFPDPGPRRPPR